MNFSYNNGQLNIECDPKLALELITIITQQAFSNNPLRALFEKGFEFAGVSQLISDSCLRQVCADGELAECIQLEKKLGAVKKLKQLTGLGLKEAKHTMDYVWGKV